MTQDELKLHQARLVWRNGRDKTTPSGKWSWREWWESRWKDDYDRYTSELMRGNDAKP